MPKFYSFIFILFWSVICYGKASHSLSLDDVILIAIRDNPNVQTSRLTYALEKFNLHVQEWMFSPHYSLQASVGYNRNGSSSNGVTNSQNVAVQPTVKLVTPVGTQFTLNYTNNKTISYNPGVSLQITQPLMRGFGKAIVEAALNNAKDSELISRLRIEGTLRDTVTAVINAYLDILTAERTLTIDQDALKRAEDSVEQTRLFIKAGRKAKNEIITVQAEVASAKSKLEDDKNNLSQAKNALLTTMGVDPNLPMSFTDLNVSHLIKKYHLLPLVEAKQRVLENDIQYQTNQILLHGQAKRNLLSAQDEARWSLDLTANVGTGNGSGGGQNAGINSLFNGINQTQKVALELTIPINNQQAKQAIFSAQTALKEAEIGLMQEKWNKETSAINSWNTVLSAKRAVVFAEDAARLQQQTYHISYQKYLHGLIDSLELQSAQVRLTKAQETLLHAKVGYLKALVSMDQLIGHTLKTWNIGSRF